MGYEKYPSIPIAGNNRSPIGIGSYRLPVDLEPIIQGVAPAIIHMQRTWYVDTRYDRGQRTSKCLNSKYSCFVYAVDICGMNSLFYT